MLDNKFEVQLFNGLEEKMVNGKIVITKKPSCNSRGKYKRIRDIIRGGCLIILDVRRVLRGFGWGLCFLHLEMSCEQDTLFRCKLVIITGCVSV